jgi:hypothetical protein
LAVPWRSLDPPRPWLRADANYRTPREVLRQIGLFVDVGARMQLAMVMSDRAAAKLIERIGGPD